ncbi:MAG TPA: NAD(P)H-dependent glycerol-3-phosphate dehydrogenase [Abditibacteriaceae bacterium]|jgi:glycerol-3-phosphate dehydrogenase (NAD(P)+)
MSQMQPQGQPKDGAPIVAVLGAGSWGTALAHLVAVKGAQTRLWARDPVAVQRLTSTHENDKYLPGARLENVRFYADLEEVLRDAQWIVSAIPCAGVPGLASHLVNLMEPHAIVVNGTKGLHPENGLRPAQIWEQEAGISGTRYVALSGPNLAREIVLGVPTATVVASQEEASARAAQELFNTPSFRVYTNTDLIGVELGGALKNVVAIAAGMGDGLGFGDNSKATLVTRAWQEMMRLAVAFGAREATLWGISGLGDLLATCVSKYSRNRNLGEHIAKGESLRFAQGEIMQVAEGVNTTRAALQLAREADVELPVTEQIAAVLFEGRDVRMAVQELMNRAGCRE